MFYIITVLKFSFIKIHGNRLKSPEKQNPEKSNKASFSANFTEIVLEPVKMMILATFYQDK